MIGWSDLLAGDKAREDLAEGHSREGGHDLIQKARYVNDLVPSQGF